MLQGTIDKLIKDVTSKSAQTNKALEDGHIHKDSPQYKEEVEKIMNYTVRLDFILTCMKCAYGLFDLLTVDCLKIFSKYEDAFTHKALVD